MKDMLAIPKHNSIVLYSSDPPYHPVKDVFWLLNQPTISMNIYVSSINETTNHQQLTTLPAKLTSGNLPYCPRIVASDNKMQNMNLTVAGLEAALAKTRQFCNELNCDVKNSVKEFTNDSEIDQLLFLANSIATDLQGNLVWALLTIFCVEERNYLIIKLICQLTGCYPTLYKQAGVYLFSIIFRPETTHC